jgi:DNA helicase II / ATP-dependent DNA helicase PcrA
MITSGVFHNTFASHLEEMSWISKKILLLLSAGVEPQNIAVIARKHAHLQAIVPIFHRADIPINYERDENILEKPFILQIINILKFVYSLNKPNTPEAEELLPEILSYPFWRIPNLTIYNLSLEASKNRQSWLQTMGKSENKDIQNLADFFRELSKQSVSCSAEQILDEILGVSREHKPPQEESEENDEATPTQQIGYDPDKGILNVAILDTADQKKCLTRYISPYKWYYFDSNFAVSKSEYFTFLSSLRVFFTAIRDYKKKQVLSIPDILEFVDLMQSNKLPLNDKSSFNQQKDTVCLLTAHKAKGLEFEFVFTINCLEKEWNGRKQVNKIGLPSNLSLLPENENIDDSLRLLFVSLTRAKKYLCLTSHHQENNGKYIESLSFLEGVDLATDPDCQSELAKDYEALHIWLHSSVQTRDLSLDEKAFLKPVLENYKLSVTHLNNFLDLSQGGPRLFLEHNLLRFPQSKLVSGSYGSAMHAAVARFYAEFRKNQSLPEVEYLLNIFKDSLSSERLSKSDFAECLEKGNYHLKIYYDSKRDSFDLNDEIEQDFANQGIVLGNAKITGKIDKMCVLENNLIVVDLKTGKSFDTWKAAAPHDQIKLDRYHRQLVFYKLLVENSREYGSKYKVNQGSLEFLEANKTDGEIKDLYTEISTEEAENLSKLIQVVYRRIQNFEFDLPKEYSGDLNGTHEFITDLILEF